MYFDMALLVLRLVFGLLLAAHGTQKLFGWFGGPGLKGTAGWLGSMGMRPAWFWALMAGGSEAGGGLLLALGFLSPLGSLGVIAAMLMAILKAHWGKGIFASGGGSELPLTYLVVAFALALIGGGQYSLDSALGVALPMPVTFIVGLVAVLGGIAVALATESHATAARPQAQETKKGTA